MSVVTECPLLFYGKLVQEKCRRSSGMHEGFAETGCSIFQRKIVHPVSLSRSAIQNYSTYVTMIHRRYKRLQHKCSPFLQVLHKRTKCLVYKRIETDTLPFRGLNSENKAGRRSLVRWPIQLIGSMTKISTLDWWLFGSWS